MPKHKGGKSPQPHNVSERKGILKQLNTVNVTHGESLLSKIAGKLSSYKQEAALGLLKARQRT